MYIRNIQVGMWLLKNKHAFTEIDFTGLRVQTGHLLMHSSLQGCLYFQWITLWATACAWEKQIYNREKLNSPKHSCFSMGDRWDYRWLFFSGFSIFLQSTYSKKNKLFYFPFILLLPVMQENPNGWFLIYHQKEHF